MILTNQCATAAEQSDSQQREQDEFWFHGYGLRRWKWVGMVVICE